MTDRQRVIDELTKPFPRQAIEKKGKFDYVSGETVIYRLNSATNYGWDFEITGHEMVGGTHAQGKSPALVVYGRMRIPIVSDGWRADMGTQLLENQNDDHEAHKGAVTDCIKRCARLFGVGLHLWGPDIEAGEIPNQRHQQAPRAQPFPQTGSGSVTPNVQPVSTQGGTIAPGVGMTDQQRKAIWGISKNERAMTDEDVEQMSKSMFGVELSALDKQQASKLIETLKQTGEPAPHPVVQNAIDNREASWIAAMEGAATVGELKRIGLEIAQAGVKEGPLRAVYAKHLDRLQDKALA